MTDVPFSIAAATSADLAELVDLEEEAFDDPWPEAALAEELARQEDLFLLIREGSSRGRPAGYACWRRALDEAELLRIAVAPSWRRQGLARRLLEEGASRLRRAGARTCYLEVRPDNHAARALYRSLGFQPSGLRPNYYRDGSPAQLYSLRLEE